MYFCIFAEYFFLLYYLIIISHPFRRLLDWRPDRMRGEPLKCERVVIIKNLFSPEEFEKDVQLILDYQQDLRSECSKCGEVKKITIHDVSVANVMKQIF